MFFYAQIYQNNNKTVHFEKMKRKLFIVSKQYLITTELNLKYLRASGDESPSDSFQFRKL